MPCTWWTLVRQLKLRCKTVLLGCSPGLFTVEIPLTLVWRTERVKKSNEKPNQSNKSTKVEVVYSRGSSSEYKVQFHFIQVHSCCSAYTPYLPEVLQRGSLWEWLGRHREKWRKVAMTLFTRNREERKHDGGLLVIGYNYINGHTCNHIDTH